MKPSSIRGLSDHLGVILSPHRDAIENAGWFTAIDRWNGLLLLMDQCLAQLLDPTPLSSRPFVALDLDSISRIEEAVVGFMAWARKDGLFSTAELAWLEEGLQAIGDYRCLVIELVATSAAPHSFGGCR